MFWVENSQITHTIPLNLSAGGGGGVAGGNANSEFVKQELRAVVSVRAQQAAAAATGGGGGGGGGVAQRGQTPQSPLQQGAVIGGVGGIVGGANSTNTMGNVTPTGSGNVNSMLNTPPDPTLGFSFETREYYIGHKEILDPTHN